MADTSIHGGKTAGLTVGVGVDPRRLQELQGELLAIPNGVERVLVRAVNKVGTACRTRIVRTVVAAVNLKATDVRERNVRLFKANYRTPSARILIDGRRVPLSRWGARKDRAGRGVSYSIRRGSRKTVAGAFFATMKTGHTGVFIRKSGQAALPGLRRRKMALQAKRKTWMTVQAAGQTDTHRARTILALDRDIRSMESGGSGRVGRFPIAELYGPSVPEVVHGIGELASGVLEDAIARDLDREIDTQLGLVIARRRRSA